jgi:hypothetical protein
MSPIAGKRLKTQSGAAPLVASCAACGSPALRGRESETRFGRRPSRCERSAKEGLICAVMRVQGQYLCQHEKAYVHQQLALLFMGFTRNNRP